MYVYAGDTIHIVVSASAGLTQVFGNDLESRLQSANVDVVNINSNGVPVSSGWTFGGLIVDVVPRIDFADIADVAGLVEGAAGAAGLYVDYGKAVAQLVATASGVNNMPTTQDYRQLQNTPRANRPDPGHVPGLMELLGLDKLLGDPSSSSSLLLIGAAIVVGIVVIGRR
jgi:hypothetical protein